MSSGRSICTRSLASLSSLTNSARKCRWIRFQTLDPISNSAFVMQCSTKYYYWHCNTSGFIYSLTNNKAGTAKQSLKLDQAALSCRICQTRKRCKRPSAKRAPGKHPGLFQISQLFTAHFPADVSPGQKEQPMFWFKDKYQCFSAQSSVDSHCT